MDTYTAAQELKTELGTVLDETATVVDLDPALINSALTAGRQAIVVRPPVVNYPTRFAAEADWTLILVPGITDLARAWGALDAMLADVMQAVDVDTVTPSQYQTAGGTLYPAFSVTFTQPYNL
jgi:hypothetical protein